MLSSAETWLTLITVLRFSRFDLVLELRARVNHWVVQRSAVTKNKWQVDRKLLYVNAINFNYYDLACNSLWVCLELWRACELFSIIFSISC
jgi:hypothetical protein